MSANPQVPGHICLGDLDPLLKLSSEIAHGDGHIQFNLILYLLTHIGKTNGISSAVLERGVRYAYALVPVSAHQARDVGAAAEINISEQPRQ